MISVRGIAEPIRRSYGFVHRLLEAEGVVLRPRCGPPKAGPHRDGLADAVDPDTDGDGQRSGHEYAREEEAQFATPSSADGGLRLVDQYPADLLGFFLIEFEKALLVQRPGLAKTQGSDSEDDSQLGSGSA